MSLKEFYVKHIKYRSIYKNYRRRFNPDNNVFDFNRGCGYYILVGFGYNPLKRLYEVEMQSGRTAICKLYHYECYHDPRDMIKSSSYQILGYKGEKLFTEMTFKEFCKSACSLNIDDAY